MKYVIELNFKTGVHFGSDVAGYGVEEVQGFAHSDTFFSALINILASVRYEFQNNQWVKDFFHEKTMNVPFKVSSFGFMDIRNSPHRYYIPKPLISPKNIVDETQKIEFGRDFKQLKFISIDTFKKWQHNTPLDLEDIIENDNPSFWVEEAKTQHLTDNITLATQIYRTGIVFFMDHIKPFFILEIDEDHFSFKDFKRLLHLLKYYGLGGRRTSGCGLFDFSDEDWFCIDTDTVKKQKEINPSFDHRKNISRAKFSELFKFKPSSYYLFSTFFPIDIHPIKPIAYELVQRKGWFFSTSSFKQFKRKTCYMFSEGSIFKSPLEGKIVDVTPEKFKEHKVFRSGIPFTIPFCEVDD